MFSGMDHLLKANISIYASAVTAAHGNGEWRGYKLTSNSCVFIEVCQGLKVWKVEGACEVKRKVKMAWNSRVSQCQIEIKIKI